MNLWSDVVVPRYFSHCQARPLFSNTGCISCLENRGKFCWEKEIKPSSLTMHSINAYPLRGEPQGPAVSTLGRLGCQVNLDKSALERILKPTELKMLNNELYCHMLAFSTPLLGCPVPLKAVSLLLPIHLEKQTLKSAYFTRAVQFCCARVRGYYSTNISATRWQKSPEVAAEWLSK